MYRSLLAVAAGAVVVAAVALAGSAQAAPAHRLTRTDTTVLRPVTSAGHAADGYRVLHSRGSDSPVYCANPGAASVVGVDANIVQCSPSAAYALACWRAAEAHHVLCFDSAHSHVLRRLRVSGPIPRTQPVARPLALNLTLANGVYCGLRDGGAAAELHQHHSWYTSYYCSNHQAVWSPQSSKRAGVNHDHPVWTVELANDNGHQHVHTVRVQDAYLVGTRH